jgi:hypothetical protein
MPTANPAPKESPLTISDPSSPIALNPAMQAISCLAADLRPKAPPASGSSNSMSALDRAWLQAAQAFMATDPNLDLPAALKKADDAAAALKKVARLVPSRATDKARQARTQPSR